MVVAGNEHVDAFLNSIQVVKNVFSPLETSIRKAAKDFEQCWPGSKNGKASNEIKNANFELGLVNSNVKKTSNDEKKKGLALKFPVKMLVGIFPEKNGKNDNSDSHKIENISRKGLKAKYGSGKKEGDCTNCLHFVVAWSLFINGFVQAIPIPFKKKVHKDDTCVKPIASCKFKRKGSKGKPFEALFDEEWKLKEGKDLSFELLLGFLVDQITKDLQKLDNSVQESESPHKTNQFDHLKAITTILEGNMNGLLSNLKFARVGGVPSSIIDVPSVKEESENGINNTKTIEKEDSKGISPQKLATGLLSIPLSNVERLRSTLSTVSLSELVELLPQLGRPTNDYPDKKKLFSVQDFFRYTEAEGRRFFEELDRDGDGQVNMEDLEVAIRKRKLPKQYASEFMRRARSHLFSKSFGWKQFLSLVEQKEPTILRAYTGLCLSKSGTLQKSEIMASLKNAGLPAYEDNAIAMMRFLNSDTEESISYGHFRNFMLLLPSDRLQEDPRSIWFEAATVVAVAPPVVIPTGSYLKSALAGGLACALSTALLHPVDTIKTQVQASTLTFPEIIAKLPQIGARGLYKGSIPAIWGQFSSHGLRTGIFEASKIFLINFAPTLPELQVQSVASFCGTFLGTAVRIPCEVLKQRLQAGLFDNVGQALVGTWERDGLKGFFRGTGATLFREIPFYVCGMGLYAESKKVAQRLLGRELEAWETITVGALSGGFTAVLTTPFDVIKTRMMTAPQGRPVSLSIVALSILRHEGPLGLFKGALPRFFWIAPLGAMNFAGYELAKKAMDKNNEIDDQKKLATS